MELSLPRQVVPEMLDGLSAGDARAQRSRADLQRLHRAMGTLSIVQRAFDRATVLSTPRTIVELGAGDGSLMLRLAKQKAADWPGVHITLLDRLNLVAPQTLKGLREVGWNPEVETVDVFDWLDKPDDTRRDIVFANLFMHHFSPDELGRLLKGIAARADVFVCCEPRRAVLPLAASYLVGVLGAGPVTREDAVLSVRAGFRAQELSGLWPDQQAWILEEHSAGLFSHCLIAMRRDATRGAT